MNRQNIIEAVVTICVMFIIGIVIFLIMGCKPAMPVRSDYADNIPCFLAHVCIVSNTYMEQNKQECDTAMTKCFRYADYEKCEKSDKPSDCWDKLGIRK